MIDDARTQEAAVLTGLISDMQRFSIHDGPGIRTTVFFKGCNLRCFWCHNPETLALAPELQLYRERCIGCGACLQACPHGAHVLQDGRHRRGAVLVRQLLPHAARTRPRAGARRGGRGEGG